VDPRQRFFPEKVVGQFGAFARIEWGMADKLEFPVRSNCDRAAGKEVNVGRITRKGSA